MEHFIKLAILFLSGGMVGTIISIVTLKKLITVAVEQSIQHCFQRKLEEYKATIQHVYQINLEEHKASIQEILTKTKEVWLVKRDACIKSLKLANAVLSNYKYEKLPKTQSIIPQYMSIEDARSCIDELACSCIGNEVLGLIKRILIGNVSPDIISELRNAIRRELGFTSMEDIDEDRTNSFIASLNCIPLQQKGFHVNSKIDVNGLHCE